MGIHQSFALGYIFSCSIWHPWATALTVNTSALISTICYQLPMCLMLLLLISSPQPFLECIDITHVSTGPLQLGVPMASQIAFAREYRHQSQQASILNHFISLILWPKDNPVFPLSLPLIPYCPINTSCVSVICSHFYSF